MTAKVQVFVKLTKAQTELVMPCMDAATKAEGEGRPGMVVAQVFGDHMVVGFIGHEKAKKISAATGADPDKIITSAFDGTDQTVN